MVAHMAIAEVTDQSISALRACANDLNLPAGEGPSAQQYELWQRSHSAPMRGQVRSALGDWKWLDAVKAAGFDRVHGV
jgi:hypothetical protein